MWNIMAMNLVSCEVLWSDCNIVTYWCGRNINWIQYFFDIFSQLNIHMIFCLIGCFILSISCLFDELTFRCFVFRCFVIEPIYINAFPAWSHCHYLNCPMRTVTRCCSIYSVIRQDYSSRSSVHRSFIRILTWYVCEPLIRLGRLCGLLEALTLHKSQLDLGCPRLCLLNMY